MMFICFYRLEGLRRIIFALIKDSMTQTLNKSCIKTLFKGKCFTSDTTVANKVQA